MKKSKKILALVMALIMIATAIPMMTASADAGDKHEHVFVQDGETKEPTCINEGVTVYTCVDEDCYFSVEVKTDALGHDGYGAPTTHNNSVTHRQYCKRCNKIATRYHDFATFDADNEANVEATCDIAGIKVMKCACGTTQNEVIPAKGHTYSSVVKDDDKTHSGVCTVCNATKAEDHIWDEGVVTTKPQCAAKGVKTFTCTVCKATKTEDVAPAHTLPAKATKVDDYTHKYTCAVAGCGHVFTTAELEALDMTATHNFVIVVGEKSLCDESVALTVTCEDCDYKLETKATQHEFKAIEKYDANSHKQVCKNCDLVMTAPHTWDEGKVTKEPTHEEEGTKVYTCTACKETKTETIAKLQFVLGDVNKDGSITAVDARIVLQNVAGLREFTDEEKELADINKDGNISAVDARIILQVVAGLR